MSKGIKYRPDIDGLRAVAVLAVLFYHAELSVMGVKLAPGGGFGVDVFFVISGFLITSLMITELNISGSISLLGFYERRARRLLPSLYTVILVSLPAAWIYLQPEQLIDFSKSIISSLAFGSNLYWNYSLQEYGAESALIKPFLHTWSLAVEEQYYILFPLMLLIVYRVGKKYALALLAFTLLVSLHFAEWMTADDPSFSFYMLPSRFWELLAGALLAYYQYYYPNRESGAFFKRVMPIIGAYLIFYSIFFIEFNSAHHPGLITIIPVLGSVLVIYFSGKNNLVTKLLSSKAFVGIGLISYSLYLWHYPIFAFSRIAFDSLEISYSILLLIITFVLSIFSYYAVERPFRKQDGVSIRSFIVIVLAVSSLIFSYCIYVVYSDGARERLADKSELYGKNEFDNKVLRKESWSILRGLGNESGMGGSNCCAASKFESSVLWYSNNHKSNVLVIGDSHSKDIFNAFYQNSELFSDFEFARYGILADADESSIEKLISSPNYQAADVLIISMKYGRDEEREHEILGALPDFLSKLKRDDKKMIVLSSTPFFMKSTLGKTLFDRVLSKNDGSELNGSFVEFVNSEYFKYRKANVDKKNQEIKNIVEKVGGVYFDKLNLVCDLASEICYGSTPDGYKSFYDYGHYTLEGSKFFGYRIYQLGWLTR